jgi:4a-hydroxytetrahydrobiopterin dehydratase
MTVETKVDLKTKRCVPCTGAMPKLSGEGIRRLLEQAPDWKVIGEDHIVREFKFPNFMKALDFVNRVGRLAEDEGHHPDIFLSWGKVIVELKTHKVDGLSENDFILAAKIEPLMR